MISDGQPVSLRVEAGEGSITSEQAVSMGLIATELVINSLKRAFPAMPRAKSWFTSNRAPAAGASLSRTIYAAACCDTRRAGSLPDLRQRPARPFRSLRPERHYSNCAGTRSLAVWPPLYRLRF